MLDALDKPAKLDAECRSLGVSHAGYGVTSEMFGAVEEALLESFEKALGDEFNDEVRSSWTKLYGIASSAMRQAQIR
jgi:nitric oxide dioxygenase